MSLPGRLILLTILLVLAGCGVSTAPNEPPPREPAAVGSVSTPITTVPASVAPTSSADALETHLTLVAKSSEVCMVNNQFMGREQIPVQVDGKTYFGCCEMCQGRLTRDPASRIAKDPLTGNAVDKATAVIAKRSTGAVLYFESVASYEAYLEK